MTSLQVGLERRLRDLKSDRQKYGEINDDTNNETRTKLSSNVTDVVGFAALRSLAPFRSSY